MSRAPHVVEIDRIVLTGGAAARADLGSLIEMRVLDALAGAGVPPGAAGRDLDMRVAGETARSVVQAVRGGEGS